MTDVSEWQGRVGTSWAREWSRTDRSFGVLTDLLFARATDTLFDTALDIGCGAGELTLRLAGAAPTARVVGLDISEELVAVAEDRVSGVPNATVELGDASCWAANAPQEPDLLVSRHGVMFFADPVAAFSHLRSQARHDARLVFSCFRERAENEWVAALAGALPGGDAPSASSYEPGPFAFGCGERVEGILTEAGWQDIALKRVDYAMIAGAGADPVADALSYFLRIGPAARTMAALDDAARDEALEKLEQVLRSHERSGVVSLPAAAWIVSARNAS